MGMEKSGTRNLRTKKTGQSKLETKNISRAE